MEKTFNMMVIDHFGYLVSEYHFWVGKILDHDPDILLEGFVEFQSPTTVVSVADEWYATEERFGGSWMIGDLQFLPNWFMNFCLSLLGSERSFVLEIPGNSRKLGGQSHPNSSNMKDMNSPTTPKRQSIRQSIMPVGSGNMLIHSCAAIFHCGWQFTSTN